MSRRLGNDRVMELAKDSSQWASEQGIKDTAEAIAYMAAKGYFDPNIESNVYPAAQQDMVISENVAMYINGTWLPNEVAATTPDDFKWAHLLSRKFLTVSKARSVVATPPTQSQSIRIAMMLQHRQQSNSSFI